MAGRVPWMKSRSRRTDSRCLNLPAAPSEFDIPPTGRPWTPARLRGRPFPGRDELERAGNQLIQSLVGSNDYLRLLQGSNRQETVDGGRALSTVLSGRSPVTGELERVRVVTRRLPDGRLIYLLFIAPERRYEELERIADRIISSLSINDPALPGR